MQIYFKVSIDFHLEIHLKIMLALSYLANLITSASNNKTSIQRKKS